MEIKVGKYYIFKGKIITSCSMADHPMHNILDGKPTRCVFGEDSCLMFANTRYEEVSYWNWNDVDMKNFVEYKPCVQEEFDV